MSMNSRVLKSDSVGELLVAGQFNYEDLQARCEAYLESVRRQARQMLLDAQQEIERAREAAIAQGRQAGLAEGLKQAESQIQQQVLREAEQQSKDRLQTVLPLLHTAAKQLQGEYQQARARWESQALELVLAIAAKLTHRQLSLSPELVCHRIDEALQMGMGSPRVVIRLAEQDLRSLGPQLEVLVETVRQQSRVELLADGRLSPGDFLIETDHGRIDARLETQISRIASELLGVDPGESRQAVDPS